MANDTDRNWEFYGKTDPYYGVLTSDQYRAGNLDEASLAAFFETGKAHIDHVFETIHAHVDPAFKPETALDFGCGVGRLLVPLAGRCASVTGVDVSASMLEEARENCVKRGVSNVTLVQSDDALSKVSGRFDLIHSVIVFQHIPHDRGERIFVRLIDLLDEGGIGALHFLFRRRSSLARRAVSWLRKSFPPFNSLTNVILKQPLNYPFMQANEYDPGRLFQLLLENQCSHAYVQLARWSARSTLYYDATIFFQRGPSPSAQGS